MMILNFLKRPLNILKKHVLEKEYSSLEIERRHALHSMRCQSVFALTNFLYRINVARRGCAEISFKNIYDDVCRIRDRIEDAELRKQEASGLINKTWPKISE